MSQFEEVDNFKDKRAKILAESIETAQKCIPQWGYFGIAGSLAIGDNSYAPKTMRKPAQEEASEPIHNILVASTKSGNNPKDYFQFMPPLAGSHMKTNKQTTPGGEEYALEPYQDPGMAMKKGKVVQLDPDCSFKPPGKVKTEKGLGYAYIEHDCRSTDKAAIKEKYKDYMPPRQILPGPPKKGGGGVLTKGVLFGSGDGEGLFWEHMPDDYDAPRQLRKKELQVHKDKMGEKQGFAVPYKSELFQPNQEILNYEEAGPTHIPRDPPADKSSKYPHEAPFRPSNPTKKGIAPVYGMSGLMGGIPEYKEDPVPGGATRKPPPAEGEEPREAFKLNCPVSKRTPTPSVTCLARNMRAERPSAFMRPSLG